MASEHTHSQTSEKGNKPGLAGDNPVTQPALLSTTEAGLQSPSQGDARYVCQVGQTFLVFNTALTIEVLLDTAIYRMPNTPAWLLGLCNRRGELVPVFNLRSLLGITEQESKKSYLFIVDKDEYAVGFFIDDYPSSVYSMKELEDPPVTPELLKDHVLNAYKHEQQTLLEIDHRSLFEAITKELSPGS